MEYIKINEADAEWLADLRAEFLTETNGCPPPEELRNHMLEYLRAHLDDGSFCAWTAKEKGRMAAIAAICFYSLPPTSTNPTGKTAYVTNVYTRPRYRRKGLAEQLVGRLLEEAAARGVGKVFLHATQAGKPVYEKLGFAASGDEMVYVIRK